MTRKSSLENQNAKIHGIYSDRLIDKSERALFRILLSRCRDLHPDANPLVLETLTIFTIKLFRAIQVENWDAADRLELMMLRLIRQIGGTNYQPVKETKATTCEQVSSFLESVDTEAGSDVDPTSDEEWGLS